MFLFVRRAIGPPDCSASSFASEQVLLDAPTQSEEKIENNHKIAINLVAHSEPRHSTMRPSMHAVDTPSIDFSTVHGESSLSLAATPTTCFQNVNSFN